MSREHMGNNAQEERLQVSAIIPVYSGENYIQTLVDELNTLRDTWDTEDAPVALREAIFVDDAAIDNSAAILDELAACHDWVHVLHLARNFGQHPATIAGILHSSGDWVVTLDEDLQHRPLDVQQLFASVAAKGSDVVYAKARTGVHESWYRDFGSRGFKTLMKKLTGNPFIENFNSFRLMRGAVARAAASVCSHETYFDMALSWFTQRIGTVTIDLKDERVLSGKQSGYSLRKLMSHARRMVVSAHTKSLRGGALVGVIALGIAIVYGAIVLFQKIFIPEYLDVRGWTSLFLAVMLFGGIISFLVSAILEYLSVILLHVQGKPTFFAVDRRSDTRLAPYFQRVDASTKTNID